MTAAAIAPFDRDTALEPLAEGLWRAHVSESWFVVNGPNGGFLAAVCARAMIEATGGRQPRSMTLHYLDAPAAGPIEVACAVERAGGTTTFVSLRVTQDGAPMAIGVGACATWREDQPEWADSQPPPAPRSADARPVPTDLPGIPRFFGNYEVRSIAGGFGIGEGRTAAWIRSLHPRPVDAVLAAALTDSLLPAAFSRLSERTIVPTIDLTIHWRAPFEGLGAHPWVLAQFTTSTGAGGVWEEDGELWSEGGVLLAQSRQLAIVRRPR